MSVTLHTTRRHNPDAAAQGRTLVLLGSLGSELSMWQPQLDDLSRDFDVIACDLRGHGASPVPQGPYTIEELAEDVITTLDGLGVDTAIVVGLSIGGAITQALAIHHPERLRGIVLSCTAARFGTPDAWQERIDTVRAEGTKALAAGVAARWFTPDFGAQGYYDTYEAMIAATPDEGYAGCAAALAAFDSHEQLAGVTTPALVITAALDPSTPPEVVADLAAHVPGCTTLTIDNAAHLVNVEQPQAFNQALRDFADSL